MDGLRVVVWIVVAILIGSFGLSYAFNGYRYYLNSIQAAGLVLGMLAGGGAGLLLTGQIDELVVRAAAVLALALLTGFFGWWLILKLFVATVFIQGALLGMVVWLALTAPTVAGGFSYLLSTGLSNGPGAVIGLFSGIQLLLLALLMVVGGLLSLFFNRIIGILASGLGGGILIWAGLALAALALLPGLGGLSGLLGTPLPVFLMTVLDLALVAAGIIRQFNDDSTELIDFRLPGRDLAPEPPRPAPAQPAQAPSGADPSWDAANPNQKPAR